MEQENQTNATTFDSLVQDRQLQMLKAAIPYINNANQKTMAFLIKFMELQRTVSIFNNPGASMQICSVSEDEEPLPLQMLNALREFCTEREQETIDMLTNYVQMFSAYETLFT
ncbi:MAG: hypothetical protein HFI76_02505 [Lachnospiraceae bacterium]|nr:hypothetical protein [Lachnospiraceae bacterium]